MRISQNEHSKGTSVSWLMNRANMPTAKLNVNSKGRPLNVYLNTNTRNLAHEYFDTTDNTQLWAGFGVKGSQHYLYISTKEYRGAKQLYSLGHFSADLQCAAILKTKYSELIPVTPKTSDILWFKIIPMDVIQELQNTPIYCNLNKQQLVVLKRSKKRKKSSQLEVEYQPQTSPSAHTKTLTTVQVVGASSNLAMALS